jgi:ABC-2 type transport system permease protein
LTTTASLAEEKLRHPGHSRGLLDIPKWGFLLKLLVRKEIRVRYRGSVLGMAWTYVKPAVQLIVYYVAMGHFLGLNRQIDNYVVYLFSGIVVVNLFNEIMRNTTGSIVWNAALVGKIYLPRELFPVSSVWVAFIHFLPQVAVLLVGALIFGWRPGPANILAFFVGVLMVTMLSLGLGLAFAAWNVLFRDAENIVELIGMVAIWVSPVFYQWLMVHDTVPSWAWRLYQSNPLAMSVELFHYAFWVPTDGVRNGAAISTAMPPDWIPMTAVSLLVAVVFVAFGQFVFRRHEGKFGQEL